MRPTALVFALLVCMASHAQDSAGDGPSPSPAVDVSAAAGNVRSAATTTPSAGGDSSSTTRDVQSATGDSPSTTGDVRSAAGDQAKPAVSAGEAAPSSAALTASAAERSTRSSNSRVMDTLDLGTTSITGNQELPKVLYIVPWKRSDLGDIVGRPVNSLLDEVLAPIDPDVFERHLSYYETLYGEGQQE